MKRFVFCILIFVPLATIVGYAQAPDQQYLHIYNLIQDADRLIGSGESSSARAKYLEADTALKKLQATYPNWNDKVIKFRIHYIEEKMGLIPSPIAPSAVAEKPSDKKSQAVDERDAQIRSLQEAIQRLEGDKAVLQAKLKEALTAQPAAADPRELAKAEQKIRNVEKEKELLQVALEQEKAQRATLVEPAALEALKTSLAEAHRRLAEQTETAAAIKREKEILERRLTQDSASLPDKAAAERIKKLEKERDDLQGRLKQAASQPAKRPNKSDSADNELISLRARLAGLEAQKVPYSPEELALFKQPAIEPAKVAANPAKSSAKNLPAAAAPLVAEAESAFRGQRYGDAERKYEEILKLDASNPSTLANLAAAQLEQKKLDEAEATLKRALTVEPNDAHAMTLLGIVKFRQGKFDEAFENLSRSAQLDPQNAEAQNYLGITLSQKGQRGPAETALRKAIQLSPGYGSAHHNLAVIYATQQPPFVELARWHYQKALAAGQPKNSDLEKLLDTTGTASGK